MSLFDYIYVLLVFISSVSERYLGNTGFSTAEGGSLAANETTNAHSLFFPPLPVCLLCSPLPPPLLSVCISLQQKHTLCSLWGDGRSLNIEPNQTGGRRGEKRLYLAERTHKDSFKVSKLFGGEEPSTLCLIRYRQNEANIHDTQGVCTALCRGGLRMKKCV